MKPTDYELIDFGHGRKLERFASYLLDRPCPQAESARNHSPITHSADFVYQRQGSSRCWLGRDPENFSQVVHVEPLHLRMALTASGQVGIFPEQQENWRWLLSTGVPRRDPCRVLNLFAYTGGSTVAAALAGAQVTHVDAARNLIPWAKANCELNGIDPAQVRWIVDDVPKFVERELRRGRQYEAIILDPPSYGHGSPRRSWKMDRDLQPLLAACAGLLSPTPAFVLLTCHTPSWPPSRLTEALAQSLGRHKSARWHAASLSLTAASGKPLDCGSIVRCTYDQRNHSAEIGP